jgi:coenzyme F420-0:L-glutamate ligase/coenzyme F420-1:gamma-L-glutamate ligase
VLRESVRIVRRGFRTLISETRHGFVCANAGVDLSNAPGADTAVLLPSTPTRPRARCAPGSRSAATDRSR